MIARNVDCRLIEWIGSVSGALEDFPFAVDSFRLLSRLPKTNDCQAEQLDLAQSLGIVDNLTGGFRYCTDWSVTYVASA